MKIKYLLIPFALGLGLILALLWLLGGGFPVVQAQHMVYPWGSEETQELMLTWESAALAAPTQRVTFTKEASDATLHVGETLTFTLKFNTVSTETQPIQVRVTDPNPAPGYMEIISDPVTITGGAEYSPTIDAIVWEGTLFPAGTQPVVITFQVRATGIPSWALPDGHQVPNTARMVDLAIPGSLPETTAEATIRILPMRIFLPIVARNHGG